MSGRAALARGEDGAVATTIDLDGVTTWYDDRGAGDPLVLLHGGFQGADTWDGMAPALAGRFRLLLPERRGHGHTPDVPGPITFDAMARDTAAFIERVVGGPADLVGHSDGAIVALLVALRRPDLVRRLVPISGTFHHAGTLGLDLSVEDAVTSFGDQYRRTSPDDPASFPDLAARVLRMWREEPTLAATDLMEIRSPTLVVVADDDSIHWEHTLELYGAIPGARLAVVPGTSHALIWEKPDLVARLVLDFLSDDPVPTLIPIRRAGSSQASAGTPA